MIVQTQLGASWEPSSMRSGHQISVASNVSIGDVRPKDALAPDRQL
jgi:hypothetical protein